ncbi:hypothetical protein HU200_058612 [Digitaria exilis]|uniref:DUF7595 domain-containing protein n=1 Tax=Digitaria exilis TaxID=1010633 RepID=A0A835E407_9POAL|nr:hypothetical protein HU200_058612 [Digitaria exilis]
MEAREPLPDDLLLEIVTRCDDAATVVRSAAVSKPLRRAILGPGFRHHHLSGLGPTAVLSLSFQPHTASTAAMVPTAHLAVSTTTTTSSPPPSRPSVTIIDSGVLESLEPVASRDGLLVVRRWGDCSGAGLSVRDTLTGDTTSLPSMGLHGRGVFFFPPALLTAAADEHRSFELLAAYSQSGGIKFQIFSSKDATWGAARDIRCHVGIGHLSRAQPAVIGRRVHWLCQRRNQFDLSVLAVDADDAAAETMTTATMTPVPAMFSSRMRPSCQSEELHSHVRLVAMGGQLRLLVAESLAVTMWTLTSPTG